ncbi:hypothetical protein RJ640_016741 [Escallonia rubra]|uniref:Zinc finger protein n=1 Tax=Escallonia rubra TaxID=112253 RepID=A0AA88R2M9_9ASTE|nr:hypothetical protein RJ640_016741 [Escallonia rubra]
MTGKAKPKKHTAKEIASKVDAALTNRGGGKAGLLDRTGGVKGGHAKYECPHCKITAPDVKSMQIHHDSKHPKIPFDESKISNLHSTVAAPAAVAAAAVPSSSSAPRPGVRGSLKKLGTCVSHSQAFTWNCLYYGRSYGCFMQHDSDPVRALQSTDQTSDEQRFSSMDIQFSDA